MSLIHLIKKNTKKSRDTAFLRTAIHSQVSQGYGRGLRELVGRYSPNIRSTAGFPVILGRDGTGKKYIKNIYCFIDNIIIYYEHYAWVKINKL